MLKHKCIKARQLCPHRARSLPFGIQSSGPASSTRCTLLVQVSNTPFIAIFGAFQLLLSQIPDFDRLWFLSVLAAVMSFSYSSIGLGLAIGKATGELSDFAFSTVCQVKLLLLQRLCKYYM